MHAGPGYARQTESGGDAIYPAFELIFSYVRFNSGRHGQLYFSQYISQMDYSLHPIGFVSSQLKDRRDAPRQGYRGAPAATITMQSDFVEALSGLRTGDEIVLITWLHQADRSTLQVHPQGDDNNPLTGVFATRSPDRPNPIGLHRARILSLAGNTLEVEPLEAIDGTPVLDIKPVLRLPEG